MHDQFASIAAIFSLMFLYFQHFGYGTTAVYLGLMLDPDAFDRQFERIEMVPPPLWRAAVAAAVATLPLVLESSVSQLFYQLLVGAVAILITGTCDSHVFRYGKSDGRSGKLGTLADAIASINLWLSLLAWFALLNWLGIDLHFELFLHDLSLLPASPTISSQIIDQAAWYTLYSFALIRAMGPLYLARFRQVEPTAVLVYRPWRWLPDAYGLRSMAFALFGIVLAYGTFSYLRELVEHVGASSYQFLIAFILGILLPKFFKPRVGQTGTM